MAMDLRLCEQSALYAIRIVTYPIKRSWDGLYAVGNGHVLIARLIFYVGWAQTAGQMCNSIGIPLCAL